jgi:siroheme synthase-like protein
MTHPVALVLENRPCLVIGDLPEAARRVKRLLEAGALVTWFYTGPQDRMDATKQLALSRDAEQQLLVVTRPIVADDLAGVWLVVFTDGGAVEAERISAWCTERQIFFCAVDQPRVSSYSHMALVETPPLQLAISTAGKVPGLAQHLKRELAPLFNTRGLSEFLEALVSLRSQTPRAQRKAVLEHALKGFRVHASIELPEPYSNSGKVSKGSGAG